jgi:transporter family protein
MWILLSVLAAVTSGISVILQKKGTSGKNVFQISAVSNTATLAVMVIVALILGSFQSIGGLTSRCWQITALSGLVLAASWITYFVALRDAEVNIMMALDKANIIAAMLLAHFMLGERITWIMICGTVLILLGTALMTETGGKGFRLWDRKNMWMFWGVVSPILQALSNIIVKLDTSNSDTTLTTTLRTAIVVVVLWAVSVFVEGPPSGIKKIGKPGMISLVSGGAVLGISFLLMYRAFYLGNAASVTPIVKANFLVSTALACIFLKERLSKRGWTGFAIVCLGIAAFAL